MKKILQSAGRNLNKVFTALIKNRHVLLGIATLTMFKMVYHFNVFLFENQNHYNNLS